MPRIESVWGKDPAKLPFDFPEVLAAIAPRYLYVHAPLGDTNFQVESARRCVRAAGDVYGHGKRKGIIEPIFGQIKQGRGFRQFLLRGLRKMRAEWRLVCLTHNLLKLHRHQLAGA